MFTVTIAVKNNEADDKKKAYNPSLNLKGLTVICLYMPFLT